MAVVRQYLEYLRLFNKSGMKPIQYALSNVDDCDEDEDGHDHTGMAVY